MTKGEESRKENGEWEKKMHGAEGEESGGGADKEKVQKVNESTQKHECKVRGGFLDRGERKKRWFLPYWGGKWE